MNLNPTHLISNMTLQEKIVKFFLLPFFTIPFRLISFFIPKDPHLWVFSCRAGKDFTGNSKAFYLYAKKHRPDIKLAIVTRKFNTYSKLKNGNYPVYQCYSLKGLYYVLRASIAFITNFAKDDLNYLTISNSLIIIEMWHGVPIKDIRWSKHQLLKNILDSSFWNIPKPTIFLSTYDQPISHTPERFNLKPNQIKPFGYPRNDIFYNSEKNTLIDFGLHFKNPAQVILYVPTFRLYKQKDPFTLKDWHTIDEFSQDNQAVFLIKRHSLDETEYHYTSKNILDITYLIDDIQPLLKATDVLITDYSSVCFDFALQHRPMIFYAYDYPHYEKTEGFCLDYYTDLPGPFAATPKELITLLKSVNTWHHDPDYQKKYHRFLDHFHLHQDGQASQRLLHWINNKYYQS
jgi:CDP-glycerol glycerophosphotransferase (TagB/SpsB family)